ncbi:MAG: helix-turn-helix transcriptional regulator [Patescibacteria group bacterium]|nr:helix-turn-helix transcriptional regulator [Patescibacteria group bacterium]MDE1940962.1 helix-turn-helix transcriptional regulator [Patescibacteria group bacterium]MDE1967213.1 helix-turn-helix transcriptional regulator [Patescibacteria group bacterium]
MFRTRSQRRKNCWECPVARTADLVGDTWSILIVRDLLRGPKRFTDLQDSLSGVSSRTLAKKLQFLESQSLLARRAFAEKPPRVEYRLTAKGREFSGIISAMRRYGERYL